MPQRIQLFSAIALAICLGSTAWAGDDEPTSADLRKADKFKPTGTVRLEATSVAVGVSVSWGQGVLSFEGEEHPFKVGGLSLVGIGGSSVKAEGQVFNLEKIEDFAGAWAEVEGSAVLGKASGGGLTLRHGDVYMTLAAKQQGAKIAAGGGALNIEFVDVAAEAE